MFMRSLTLITALAFASQLLAADSDSPLNQDRGRARPLIVIAPSSVDPTLVRLKKALAEPDNRKAFDERNMVRSMARSAPAVATRSAASKPRAGVRVAGFAFNENDFEKF